MHAKTLEIEIKTGKIREQLLPKLKDRVFHLTKYENWVQILESGGIRGNKDGYFPRNWNGKSEASFCAMRNYVSVWDFREFDRKFESRFQVSPECGEKGHGFHPQMLLGQLFPVASFESRLVYLFLNLASVPELFTNEDLLGQGAGYEVVPIFEAGIPNIIPLSAIDEVLVVSVRRSAQLPPMSEETERQILEKIEQMPKERAELDGPGSLT